MQWPQTESRRIQTVRQKFVVHQSHLVLFGERASYYVRLLSERRRRQPWEVATEESHIHPSNQPSPTPTLPSTLQPSPTPQPPPTSPNHNPSAVPPKPLNSFAHGPFFSKLFLSYPYSISSTPLFAVYTIRFTLVVTIHCGKYTYTQLHTIGTYVTRIWSDDFLIRFCELSSLFRITVIQQNSGHSLLKPIFSSIIN